MAKNPNDINMMPTNNKGPFIDIREADASTDTKTKTVFGELIDVIQFAIMTAFGELIDVIAKYAYGIKQYLSHTTIAGIDMFSYGIMIWLASVRVDKYKQRHELFKDKNSEAYYDTEANALFQAMTKEEKEALIKVAQVNYDPRVPRFPRTQEELDSGFKVYMTLLLKHDAARLDIMPSHTKAKKTLMQANLLFDRVRKRPEYVNYKFEPLLEALGLKRTGYAHLANEVPSAKSIMYYKLSTELNLTLDAAENLLSELMLIEKYWKKTLGLYETNPEKQFWAFIDKQWHTVRLKEYKDKEFNHEWRLEEKTKAMLTQRNLENDDLKKLKACYKIFHQLDYLHDQNDQNFYKANERGILEYEKDRTATKIQVFTWVRRMSLIATPLSILIFFAVTIHHGAALTAFVPLFLVGTTSLVDELIDIRYKYQKWKQSVAAKEAWQKNNTFSVNINGKPVNMLEKIKALIDARDSVPESLSDYSAQELIYLHAISCNDNQTPKEQQDRNTRQYLSIDIKKAIQLFSTEGSLDAVQAFIKKATAPLSYGDDQIKAYIHKHADEINEFRFYEEGYIKGSDDLDTNKFDKLYAAGMRYLESQYKINQQYENRVSRRQTKMIQSCFSFNGVFWGVLASMAVHVLLLSANTFTSSTAMQTFNIVGFVTIGIAAIASGIMIKYQLNQNSVKAQQKNEEHYLQMNHVLTPSTPGAPTSAQGLSARHKDSVLPTQQSVVRFSHHPSLGRNSNNGAVTAQRLQSTIYNNK